ncbi:MAG: tetratricopeptide repeat protein, partial [Deltaproteobacteria bacterium]|nr:tetratricopeptide repeat protein [Deltaproteobacteria bacterium]
MTPLLLTLLVAGGERPTLAIVPPVSIDGADTWLGLAVADNLANALLRYQRQDKKSGRSEYPLNVFSWRESTAAARAEGLDLRRPLSPESVNRLAKQLGSRYVFTGSYRVKPGKAPQVLLKWRLVDITRDRPPKEVRVTTNLATLSRRTDALVAAVLKGVGERPPKSKAAPAKYRTQALKAYAGGLEVLAQQSLDPYAQVVLQPIEIKKAHVLFAEATRSAPDLLRAWVGLALASAMLGELDRAEKEILHALAHADSFEPLNAVGLSYLYVRQNRPQDALKALNDAVNKQPGFMGALGYLGSAHLRAGQPKKAIEVFRTYKVRVP